MPYKIRTVLKPKRAARIRFIFLCGHIKFHLDISFSVCHFNNSILQDQGLGFPKIFFPSHKSYGNGKNAECVHTCGKLISMCLLFFLWNSKHSRCSHTRHFFRSHTLYGAQKLLGTKSPDCVKTRLNAAKVI